MSQYIMFENCLQVPQKGVSMERDGHIIFSCSRAFLRVRCGVLLSHTKWVFSYITVLFYLYTEFFRSLQCFQLYYSYIILVIKLSYIRFMGKLTKGQRLSRDVRHKSDTYTNAGRLSETHLERILRLKSLNLSYHTLYRHRGYSVYDTSLQSTHWNLEPERGTKPKLWD